MVDTLAVYGTLCGMLYASFNGIEKLLKEERLKDISSWLKGSESTRVKSSWVVGFVGLFDALFLVRKTQDGIFMPSFLRSIIVSLVTVYAIYFILSSLNYAFLIDDKSFKEIIIFITVFSLFFNILPDYLSIIETRFILDKVRLSTTKYGYIFFYSLTLYLR